MSTNLKGVIGAHLDQGDQLETALNEIQDGIYLSTAAGVQLDILGRVYNLGRIGRSDTEYRKALQAKAATAVNGTPDEIVTFVRLAYGIEAFYTFEGPGSFFLEPQTSLTISQLEAISPAGVGAYPADYATLENGEYETLENGEYILQVNTAGVGAWLQDTLDAGLDLIQDTLDAPDTLQDTLEF